MNSCLYRYLLLIGLVVAVVITRRTNAQTIELKSAQASVLTAAERDRFLAAHNAARKVVEVDSVSWSEALSKYALESLEQQKESLIDAAKEGWNKRYVPLPAHRSEYKHGENVAAWAGTSIPTAEQAVALWLREKKAFDKLNADAESPYLVGDEEGKSETDAKGQTRPIIVGHYTAIVWRDTQQIGAAKLEFELVDDAGHARRYVAIVCNYDPPGNRTGRKPF